MTDFPRETACQSSHWAGGSLAEASVLPAHASDTHQNIIKHSAPALMDMKEHRRKTKLNCSKQPKRCRAAQRSHLPGGSTARCHPHPMHRKENCHWEKKLCFLVFSSTYFSLSLFSDKTQDFSKCPTNAFCSSQLFFFLTWGPGLLKTVITEGFLLYQNSQQLSKERARNIGKMEILLISVHPKPSSFL